MREPILKKLYSLCFLLFCLTSVLAQDNYYYNYTVKDGLPSNITYTAVQDENDLLWIGTEKGISVYNGYKFKTVNIGEELESNDVWKLVMDKYKRIWIFTTNSEAVLLIKGKSFSLNELTKRKTQDIAPWSLNLNDLSSGAANNYLLLANKKDSAFYLNANNNLEAINFPGEVFDDIRSDKILNCTFLKEEIILLYKNGKISTWDYSGKKIKEQHEVNLTHPRKIDFSQNINNKADKLCLQDGKQVFVLRENRLVRTIESNEKFNVKNIIGFSSDYIFTKENNRLISIDSKDWNNSRILSENINNAKSIFEDKEKNIWIFSYDKGIYLLPYQSQNSKIYNKSNGLINSNITCMNFDQNGELLIGNNFGKSTTIFENGKFYELPKSGAFRDYFIFSDKENNIWTSALKVFEENKEATFKEKFISKENISTSIKSYCKIDSTYYFGGNQLYKCQLVGDKITLIPLKYSNDRIYSMASYLKNDIYLGTTHGVLKYNLNSKKTKRLQFENNYSNIRSLAQHKGILWIASDKEGLIVYDIKKETKKIIPSFKNIIISEIHINSSQQLAWISTNKGLFKVRLKSFDILETEIQLFSTTNGLPTNEVNCCRIKGNDIYVGTSEGLAIIKNEKVELKYKPKISVSAVYINGSLIDNRDKYELTASKNHLTVEFNAVSFSSLGNVRYKYKLEGIDKDWISSKGRVLEYPNLSPGIYRLIVVGYDAMGQKTSNRIDMTFEIKKPFYKRWWFVLLTSLLIMLLVGYFAYSYYRKERFSQQLTSLKLEALQSQLNSHFIFNALNAIQMYVVKNDQRAANKYMSQFALLIRSFLDSSRNKTVLLSNEIKFIKTYISLEEIINEGKFDVQIDVDPKLNLNYAIPSNVIQPFVENAIVHGLLHQEKKGLLSLRFLKAPKKGIRCEIEDDGIGYEQSIKNKKSSKPSHGLNILKERIEVLKKAYGLKIDFTLFDKSQIDKSESGTLVVINFRNERTTQSTSYR